MERGLQALLAEEPDSSPQGMFPDSSPQGPPPDSSLGPRGGKRRASGQRTREQRREASAGPGLRPAVISGESLQVQPAGWFEGRGEPWAEGGAGGSRHAGCTQGRASTRGQWWERGDTSRLLTSGGLSGETGWAPRESEHTGLGWAPAAVHPIELGQLMQELEGQGLRLPGAGGRGCVLPSEPSLKTWLLWWLRQYSICL